LVTGVVDTEGVQKEGFVTFESYRIAQACQGIGQFIRPNVRALPVLDNLMKQHVLFRR
jgi:hypothetical protein